jgi:hypothetical protein
MEQQMSAPTNAISQFGRTLAFAERTMTTVLRQHLEERDTTPETWYALSLIATDGPKLAREALNANLEGSPTMTAHSASELLARLNRDGLIIGDEEVDLTPRGKSVYSDLRDYISAPTVRLLSQFDAGDIETTVRTLQAITQRAATETSDAE